MRLDHLLSREPCCGDREYARVFGCVFVVSCAHAVFISCLSGVGVGAFLGLGMEYGHAVGFTVNTCGRVWPASLGAFGFWGLCGGLFVICIVVVSILLFCGFVCLVLLGIRWMPWHQELMKDVAACDMPRGVGERTVIRGCPNGGT